jgi:hypothetical protein
MKILGMQKRGCVERVISTEIINCSALPLSGATALSAASSLIVSGGSSRARQ